ncbi:MAG: hypothetical protein O3A51_07630 [Verrucomicrobia bacterium]|nr:hypothetical protein [Verrucomicrobiota bacterium]
MDSRIRELAERYGTSLNEAVVSAISRGVGLAGDGTVHHDLDDLIGTWVPDDACDQALDAMDRIDPEIWS